MKKVYIGVIAALLTFCGVNMMAAFLSLTGTDTNDSVSLPSSISVQAGDTISVPISLENSNAYYVGFQMNVVLPQDIKPVLNNKRKVTIRKSDRLAESHSISSNYDEANNTIKLLCSSMDADVISGTSGELFFIDVTTDVTLNPCDYYVSLTNITFSTNTDAPEGAQSYQLSDVYSLFSVTEGPVNSWTVAGYSEIFGSYWEATDTNNDMSTTDGENFTLVKNSVSLWTGNTYEFKVVGNHSWNINYGQNGERDGMNAYFSVTENGTYDVTFHFNAVTKAISVTFEKVVLDVPAALDIISTLSDGGYTMQYYNIKGIVTSITDISVTYGNATFKIESADAPGQELLVYRAYGFNGQSITDENLIMVGDEVEIYGQLINYNGTPEIRQGCYLVSINGGKPVTSSFALSEGQGFEYGSSVQVDNCTLIFGSEGVTSESFKSAIYLYRVDGFPAYTQGNGINGNNDGGTWYTFKPELDGTIMVVVVLNAGKSFFVEEDGVALADFNGITVDEKYYGTFTFPVKGGKTYKVYCTGSKLGFYGFNYSYTGGEVDVTKLVERLQNQVTNSQNVLEGLTYNNVPGASDLSELISTINANLDTYQDASTIRNLTRNLASLTMSVTQMNAAYESVEAAILRVVAIADANEAVNAALKAEATEYFATIRNGLGAGSYNTDDIESILSRLNNYYAPALSAVTLVIDVKESGTLVSQITAKGYALTDIKGLVVSGKLNSDDMSALSSSLINVEHLDLSETNITEIPSNQFYNHDNLITIQLPKNLNSIGGSAFENCDNLQDVTFPGTLRTIESYAFRNCPSIEHVVIPEGVTSIGNYAFHNNTDNTWNDLTQQYEYTCKLQSVSLPSTLISMGNYAFAYNPNLKTVTMADGITTIGNYTFRNCYALTDLRLPATLQTINSYAFQNCQKLQNLTLPEGLQNLGYYSFYGCDSLTAVELPSTLQSIGYYAFGYCYKLKSIISKNVIPLALSDCLIGSEYDSQCTLYVPNISVNTYRAAPYWMNFQIVGIDIQPENIFVSSKVTLDWPDNIDGTKYKPNLRIGHPLNNTSEGAYGALTVNGNNTMSIGNFSMVWDPAYRYSRYNDVSGNYDFYYYAYATLKANTPMRADNVSVELQTETFRWDFISFPFDVKVSDITNITQTNAPLVIRRYDGQNRANSKFGETWVDMTPESTLEAGKGYIWQSANGDEEKGSNTFLVPAQNNINKNNIFTTEDVMLPLDEYISEFSQNRSWNLVGNPYPTYYDIRAIQTTAPITVWNGYNNNYQAYSPTEDAYILNPGQAFFIQRPLDQESITFLKAGRQMDLTINTDVTYGDAAAPRHAASTAERYVFNLQLTGSDEKQSDRTRIVINPDAKLDYEAARDASKFMSLDNNAAQLFTLQNDVRYAINERPLQDGIIELGLSIGSAGSYTITLSTTVEGEVYLVDRETGVETRLDGTEGYTFQATKGTSEGRFFIRIAGGNATGISSITTDGQIENIFDLQGRRVNDATRKGLYIKNGKKAVVK